MRRLLGRAVVPVALTAVLATGFVLLGPPSAETAGERLKAMAPPVTSGGSELEAEIRDLYARLEETPATVDAYVLLGNAYLQHVRETGDPADYLRAEAALDEARRQEPDNTEALVGLGVLALARHDFSAALELGQRASALAPYSARALGVVVDAQTELGRYDEAVATAQRMVDLRPDLASLSRVAYQRELRGDIHGAIEAMGRAFDASAGGVAENREYVRVLIGDLYLLLGDRVRAGQIYAASLEVVPGFVPALAGQARVAVAAGDYGAAAALYREATDALPLPELLVALGEAQEAAGQSDAARGTYELVAAMQQLYSANGVNVDLELAVFEANHGDPARAVDLARRAYGAQPNVKAADALGWALFRAGRTDEAARYADEALRLGTPYASHAFHAGMISRASGRPKLAAVQLTRALTVGPLGPLDRAQAMEALAAMAVR